MHKGGSSSDLNCERSKMIIYELIKRKDTNLQIYRSINVKKLCTWEKWKIKKHDWFLRPFLR